MPHDLRTWIGDLEGNGRLVRLTKPVSPEEQLSALLYKARGRAVLFESLRGYSGWRGIGQAVSTPQDIAAALNLDVADLTRRYAALLGKRLAPRIVKDGPVKELITKGDDIDVTKLPANVSGRLDGGRFITAGLCVTKDPDTGNCNLSFHRLQIKRPRETGFLMVPRNTMRNFQKYRSRGEPMPMAVVLGHHPALYLAGAASLPYGEDEIELAGALLDEPIDLVPCETVDLNVPANAEIVLEGYVQTDRVEEEGPFAEFQGYYLTGAGKNPVFRVDCVTTRSGAIYKYLQNELEGNLYCDINYSAIIYNHIVGLGGGPQVHNVRLLPGLFGAVVQMTPRYAGEGLNVLLGAMSTTLSNIKTAIAVDDDVDIYDDWDILWSLDTRVSASRDVVVVDNARIHPMDPTGAELVPPGSEFWHRVGSRLAIDATKPPLSSPASRSEFERISPPGIEETRLEDFL